MRMTWKLCMVAFLSVLLIGSRPVVANRSADDPKLEGMYKLILIPPLQEVDFLVMTVTSEGGTTSAKLDKVQELFPSKPTIEKFTRKGDEVRFAMKLEGADHPFVGRLNKGGDVLGTLQLQGNILPARLEKSADGKLKPFGMDAKLSRSYFAVKQDKDALTQSARLKALLLETGDSPKADVLFVDLLSGAEKANLPEEIVRGHVAKWLEIAKPYGEVYLASVQSKIGKALAGQKAYANLAFELATEAEKALAEDATTESRASVARNLADSAKLAGKADIASAADARATVLEKSLDDAYRKTVPPFEPTPYPGRKTKGADRVVLMELFTGAECPPCVAADVAFDALIHAYKPTELIALQYHLHIPGPDPLTNADSVARQTYYPNFEGTPSIFFNGKSFPGGGGSMEGAKAKFAEYADAISKDLEGKSSATIVLKATRTGDEIKINATASAPDAKPDARLKLRLVVIEEEVRYPGGNRLRLHHHVVRALPGGVSGQSMTDGKGTVETTMKISSLRKDLETYLGEFARTNGSFSAHPPLALEKLSVVAFVQDDGDKSVLHSVIVPLSESKP